MTEQPQIFFPISRVDKPFENLVMDPTGSGKGVAAIPIAAIPKGYKLKSLKKYFDIYRIRPEFREGTVWLADLGSFIDWVNRYKADSQTVIFDRRVFGFHFYKAIFDYNPPGPNHTETGRGKFKAVYIGTEVNALSISNSTGLRVFKGKI